MKYWPGTQIPKSTGNAFDMKRKSELSKWAVFMSEKIQAGKRGGANTKNRKELKL